MANIRDRANQERGVVAKNLPGRGTKSPGEVDSPENHRMKDHLLVLSYNKMNLSEMTRYFPFTSFIL